MAVNEKIKDGVGAFPEPSYIVPDKDGKIGSDALLLINNYFIGLSKKINGGISFGAMNQAAQTGNIDGQAIKFTTPSVADTEFSIAHGLGRVPVFTFQFCINKNATIYASQYESWTKDTIKLKCSAATAEFILVLV
jgi:hypothetical protein